MYTIYTERGEYWLIFAETSIWPWAYIATEPIYLPSQTRVKYGKVAKKPRAILRGKYQPIFTSARCMLYPYWH